jgi:hypothetical protein
MSVAEAVVAASVVLALAFLILIWPRILRSFPCCLAERSLPRLPTRLVSASRDAVRNICAGRAFAGLLLLRRKSAVYLLLGVQFTCYLECTLAVGSSLGEPERIRMIINMTRRAALILLAGCAASPALAQASKPQNGEFVRLDRPATFDMNPNTGSLKESVQKGQELVWHPKDKPNEPRFKVTNMAVAFLRSESGGQVKMTFTGNLSSLGYSTLEEVKLNAIVRAKGGASLHSWSFGISVKCADKDQSLTPLTHDVPNDLAQNIFTNVSTVEIAEPTEPSFPGVSVQRCN